MKVVICGSRDFDDFPLLCDWCDAFVTHRGPNAHIITGGARGADSLAAKWAALRSHQLYIIPANWEAYGKKAGFIRNKMMIDNKPDMVIAFWDGDSRGTANTIQLAKERKIPTAIIYYNGTKKKR